MVPLLPLMKSDWQSNQPGCSAGESGHFAKPGRSSLETSQFFIVSCKIIKAMNAIIKVEQVDCK